MHPRLELIVLSRAGFLVEGQRSLAYPCWNNRRTGLWGAAVSVDLIDPANPFVVIESLHEDLAGEHRNEDQVVLLTQPDATPRRRRFFLCPCTGKTVETLAFRDGRWASMLAQNLKNQSQRSKRFFDHDLQGYRDFERPSRGGETDDE